MSARVNKINRTNKWISKCQHVWTTWIKLIHQNINKLINELIHKKINELINKLINKLIYEKINELVNAVCVWTKWIELIHEKINELINKLISMRKKYMELRLFILYFNLELRLFLFNLII